MSSGVTLPAPGDGRPRPAVWWEQEAQRLQVAERRRVRLELLSRRRPGLTLTDAYRVQRCGVAARVRDGARIVGHKVGLTSEAMQRQVGIDTPDSGILLDGMAVADTGVLRVAELLAPRVEAEIGFRLGRDLRGPGVTGQGARDAVAQVCLALEVIDTRYTLEGITLSDSVADNAGCARFVLGDPIPMPGWDLGEEELTVSVQGVAVAAGLGRAVLGDPIRSVVWLTRHLATSDAGLRAGDVVLAGAVHASIPLTPGHVVSVSSPQVPGVSLHAV